MSKKKWNWSINNIEIEGYEEDTGKYYVSNNNLFSNFHLLKPITLFK